MSKLNDMSVTWLWGHSYRSISEVQCAQQWTLFSPLSPPQWVFGEQIKPPGAAAADNAAPSHRQREPGDKAFRPSYFTYSCRRAQRFSDKLNELKSLCRAANGEKLQRDGCEAAAQPSEYDSPRSDVSWRSALFMTKTSHSYCECGGPWAIEANCTDNNTAGVHANPPVRPNFLHLSFFLS